MICNVCKGSGFINLHQINDIEGEENNIVDDNEKILEWIDNNEDCGVSVCTCCGDGRDWYGEPGSHYHNQDPPGMDGPYSYNGGTCECN